MIKILVAGYDLPMAAHSRASTRSTIRGFLHKVKRRERILSSRVQRIIPHAIADIYPGATSLRIARLRLRSFTKSGVDAVNKVRDNDV
jgi:hypothetical protein